MPSVELFLTYATYKIVDNKAIIHLFGRTLKCEQICVIDRSFEPFFLVKAKKDPQQLKHQLQELKLKDGEESAEVLRVDDESLKLHSNSIEVFKVIVNRFGDKTDRARRKRTFPRARGCIRRDDDDGRAWQHFLYRVGFEPGAGRPECAYPGPVGHGL